MGKGLRQAAAGRQATLTIGPNQTALSSRIDQPRRVARAGGCSKAPEAKALEQLQLGPRPPPRVCCRITSEGPPQQGLPTWKLLSP
jgi:hypothetical protein